MRILLVSDEPRDPAMGGAKVALKLQAALRGLGHVCDALFRPDLGPWPRSQRWRLAMAPSLAWRAVAAAKPREARPGQGYDLIDAASAEGWLLATAWGGWARRRAALVARSHQLEHGYYQELLADARAGRLHKPWMRRCWYPATRLPQVTAALRRADAVIVPNPGERAFIAARGWQPETHVRVVPHGIEARHWEQSPPPGSERGAGLLFCGWWTTGKGVADLARAHGLLLERGLAVPLTLLGVSEPAANNPDRLPAGEEGRIRTAFAAASQPWLTLVPRTRREEAVLSAYRRHDVLVCPSTSEGFGMVVMEALSQRLPVVCCSTVGAAAWLRHGVEALITPPRDPEALADAIAHLWLNPDQRLALGEAGHRATRAFTWGAVARQTLTVYDEAWRHRHAATLAEVTA